MTPETPRRRATPDLTDYVDRFGERFLAASAAADASAAPLRPHPRRRGLAGGGFLVVATVAILALLVLPNGQVDVVKEASAALGKRGEIIHYRSAFCGGSFQGQRDAVAEDCGYRGDATEVWQTTSGRPRWRMVAPAISADGDRWMTGDGQRLVGPQIFGLDGDTSTAYWPQINRLDITTELPADSPRYPNILGGMGEDADVIATLRAKLSSGALKVASHTREGGRAVVLLTGRMRTTSGNGKPPSGTVTESTLRYLVDAKSFAPVRLTTQQTTYFFKGNGRPADGSSRSSFTQVFPLFERLPLNAETQRMLAIVPVRPPTKTVKRSAMQIEVEEKARMRRENAEGHARALRMQAQRKAEARKTK